MRPKPCILIAAILSLAGWGRAQDSVEVKYKGAAWLQFGRVEHSTDSLSNGGPPNNMNKNWIQAAGVQVSATAKISPEWDGGMGMFALQTHNARGDVSVANNYYPYWVTGLSEARITYSLTVAPNQKFQANLGYFNYNYNPEVKDLGLYLLRGYVYPGAPVSSFEAKHTTPAANIFGAMTSYSIGGLKDDLLLISETEDRPYFDFSVADVLSWQATPALQLGVGVNFYRALPRNGKYTSPTKSCANNTGAYQQIDNSNTQICYELDTLSIDTVAHTAVVDTVLGSLAGTKLMGRFRYDPKAALGLESLGKQDLVLYGEVGVLGLKNYPKYYKSIKERTPIMLGLNLPAWGYLDKFSLEVEYYGSKNSPDVGNSELSYSWVPRQVPGVNFTRDNFKWAFYFSKVVAGHLRLSGQVADDHLRMFGPPDIGYTSWAESLTTPKDWYWMLKSTYFF